MTTLTQTPPSPLTSASLHAQRLPRWAPYLVFALTAAISVVVIYVGHGLGGGVAMTVVATAVLFVLALSITSRIVEGARRARNRVATTLIYGAFILAALPLVSVVRTLVVNGHRFLSVSFLQHSMRNVTPFQSSGGAYHAILGTLEQVAIAAVITIPLGIACAIYMVEYGRGRIAGLVRFFVDVMTGIPSIVCGLFILAFWVTIVSPYFNGGRPGYSGFAASLALSVLMLPTITRSSEEMIRLVPAALREGAYALGIPKWKTIVKIVLPTALTGIVTGVMLAIARAAGETAPVLLVAGGTDSINQNPFQGNQESLSVFIYTQAGSSSPYGVPRAWAAALTLVIIVLALTITAKLISRRSKLK